LHLHEIEQDSKVFIDANIFVYHFSEGSGFNKSCTTFLSRIETHEIHGITSTAVVVEATHRLMMVEASSVLDEEIKNLPKYLKKHPHVVKQMSNHLAIPGKIEELDVEILQITPKIIKESQAVKTKYGFLSNDSLTVRFMEELGVSMLASNDLDFRRVEWLKLYVPSVDDVPSP